jgi:glycosyltransferase involved in cell wall biosynthesis
MGRKLLFVVNHAGFFLSHRLPIASAAMQRGWQVHVATPASKHVSSIQAAGLDWHEVRLTRSGTSPVGELRALGDLRRLYRDLRPDLVHHVTTKPVLWGTIAARTERVPAVVNALAGLGHLSLAEDLFHRALRTVVRAGFRFSLRHPRMNVIFQNEEDRQAFTRGNILSPRQTVIIPGSGVDPEIFRPRTEGPHDPPVVMLPSRMLVSKGVGEFVEAARILRSESVRARFVLVGEPDPDNPASIGAATLDEWSRSGTVELWGRRSDMPAVYAEADIVCLPSYREGMPKVLIEASSCGLPCISTDVPGCRDAVVDGETGLLVPARDRGVEIARAVRRLLEDPSLRRRMGEKGRARVLEHFSLARIVDLTLQVYEDVVQ